MQNADYSCQFDIGTEIFHEGQVGDCAYVIEQGHVEISTRREGHKTVLEIMGAGDIFGEMAIIDGGPRTATATAVAPTTLTIVTNEQISTRIKEADPVLGMLLKVVMERFRSGLRRDSDQLPKATRAVGPLPNVSEQDRQSAIGQMKLEGELRRALDRDELVLHYQPIVDLRTSLVAGFETLMRWNHPERGLLSPHAFIHVAEQTELIQPIGLWAMAEACRSQVLFLQTLSEVRTAAQPLFLSVNLSARQFTEEDFVDKLLRIARAAGADPHQIKLEVVESLLVNYKAATHWINACKQFGFSVALDDFGTGYSSLSYLHNFPFDTLKIDRSFVTTMLKNQRSMEIVQVMLSLARGLEMNVVAEGIEEPSELHKLRAMGCAYGQGFLLSRPLERDNALALLRSPRKLVDVAD